MSFCSNCGKTVSANTKFCIECGEPINFTEDKTIRKQEFVGKVVKCPSCGMGLPSFTAVCPECGHEINSVRVSSSIKDFTEKMTQCDMEIANSNIEIKRGWSTWGTWGKIGWIFLNFSLLGIPILISVLWHSLGIGGGQKLTAAEKKKVTLIDNFAFPNDRESILEALLFIKSQVASLSSGKIDKDTVRWIKIWKNKANQLFEKAEIMFKGDKIASEAFSEIKKSEKRVMKSLNVKVIFFVVLILVLFLVYLGISGNSDESTSTNVQSLLVIAAQIR